MPPRPHRPDALAWQVFRGSAAVQRGLLTRNQLRGASWLRVRHDVYADIRLHRDHRLSCRAALLRLPPEAIIAGPSAAYLHGVAHAASFADDVHVLVPRSARAESQPGIRVHTVGADLPIPAIMHAGAIATCPGATTSTTATSPGAASSGPLLGGGGPLLGGGGGLRWSSPAQAAWETAVWAEPTRAVAIVDSLLGAGLATRAALAEVAERNADRPGGRRARWLFGLADGGAQAPPESHLRIRLVLAGLPRPVTRYPIRVASGLVLHPDLAWPGFRVAIEYDGDRHVDVDQLHRDRQRLNQLVGAGWVVLHVTGRRLQRDFPTVVREVRAALVARGWRR